MCSTTAWGAVTDGSRAIGRDDIVQGTGPSRVQLRDNFMVTPGRSRIRFADNVNAKTGEYLPSVQTNVWVDLNTRTGRPERQARGGNVRAAGLTRIADLQCRWETRRVREECVRQCKRTYAPC